MHVLVLAHSGARDHLGGSDLSLLALLDHWMSHDPQVTVTLVSPASDSSVAREARARNFTVITLPFEGWVRFARPDGKPEELLRRHRDFGTTQRLIALLDRDRPNLVLTSTLVAPWAAYAAAAVGIPHVWLARESLLHADPIHAALGIEGTLRAVGDLSVLVVANSRTLADELREFVPMEKLKFHYPTIDIPKLRNLAREPTEPGHATRRSSLAVVVLGRVTRAKGQWRVIEALGLLRQRGVAVTVTFVGLNVESGASHLLVQRAKRLGVADAVTFVGEHPNPFPYVSAADVAVNPSDFESFGRTTLECMALGIPVVATARGAAQELIVDGESGFHFEPDDVQALADRLELLALEPATRQRLASAASARAAQLMDDAHPRILLEMLEEASVARVAPRPEAADLWLSAPPLLSASALRALRELVRIRHCARRMGAILRDPWRAGQRALARRRTRSN